MSVGIPMPTSGDFRRSAFPCRQAGVQLARVDALFGGKGLPPYQPCPAAKDCRPTSLGSKGLTPEAICPINNTGAPFATAPAGAVKSAHAAVYKTI